MDHTQDATPARPHLVVEDWPPVAGSPGLTQGAYGQVGNLEVVAPAVDDGLWVGWWNSDMSEPHESARSGAAVGCWSGALRFGRGHRFTAATITQVSHGPDWLECLARTDGQALHRLVWSPADGFVDHGTIATGVTSYSPLLELPDRSLRVVCLYDDSRAELLAAEPAGEYPSATFTHTPLALPGPAGALDAAGHGDHLDLLVSGTDGQVAHGCPDRSPMWRLTTSRGRDARLAVGPLGTVAAVADAAVADAAVADASGWRLVGIEPPVAEVHLGPGTECALATATLAGGPTWQVLVREGSGLTHHAVDGTRRHTSQRLNACVWSPAGAGSVHRDPP